MEDLRPVAAVLALAALGAWPTVRRAIERRQSGDAAEGRPGWQYRANETGPAPGSSGPSWGARAGAAWGRWRAGR